MSVSNREVMCLLEFSKFETKITPYTIQNRSEYPNRITTAKFNWFTWIPLSVSFQFKRAANVYFFANILLTLFEFSPKDPYPDIVSFVLVLAFTAFKDLFEDNKLRKEDRATNTMLFDVYHREKGVFERVEFQKIKMGDICRVHENESFPADLLLIDSSEENKIAYISIASLNGETNFQEKRVPKLFQNLEKGEKCAQEIYENNVSVHVNSSDETLDDFTGEVKMKGDSTPFTVQNVLYQSAVLHDVEYAIGIVCYVGKLTKANRNRIDVCRKFSLYQRNMNKVIMGFLCCLIVIALYCAAGNSVTPYIPAKPGQKQMDFFMTFLAYVITFNCMVPISLYITFETVRLIISFKINRSKSFLCNGHRSVHVKTGDSIDDLGLLNYIFCDKTGTLTKNEMILRYVSIMNEKEMLTTWGRFPGTKMSENTYRRWVRRFFINICLCNTLKVGKNGDYVGTSPDEKALVEGSRAVAGTSLVAQEKKKIGFNLINYKIVKVNEEAFEYEILHTFDFTSDRKRMSVVVKDANGKITLFCKGADEKMEKLIKGGLHQSVTAEIYRRSCQGLRNLVFAEKELDEVYDAWFSRYTKLVNENAAKFDIEACETELEMGLTFSGISSLEDELQDKVPMTIQRLKLAKVQPWVLTGDNVETAVAVAYSCGLFSKTTELEYLTEGRTLMKIGNILQDIERRLAKASFEEKEYGLIVSGEVLKIILTDTKMSHAFYRCTKLVKTCLCSRLSPIQKRDVVKLVKKFDSSAVTAAIGDGGNDVAMISEAHIGIGIQGKEGGKAAALADYAVDEFHLAGYLILHYGRESSLALGTMLGYFFYKNLIAIVPEFIWAHQVGFNGQTAFPSVIINSYNIFLTSLPAIITCVFETHIHKDASLRNPNLYHEGYHKKYYNSRRVLLWLLNALVHGVLVWVIPFYVIVKGSLPQSIKTGPGPVCDRVSGDCIFAKAEMSQQFSLASLTSFVVMNLVVHYKLCIVTRMKHILSILSVVLSIVLLIIIIFLTDIVLNESLSGLTKLLYLDREARWLILFLPCAILSLEFLFAIYQSIFTPSPIQVVEKLEHNDQNQSRLIVGASLARFRSIDEAALARFESFQLLSQKQSLFDEDDEVESRPFLP